MQKTYRLFVFTYTYLIDGLRKGRWEGNFSPIKLLGITFLRLEVFVLQILREAEAESELALGFWDKTTRDAGALHKHLCFPRCEG